MKNALPVILLIALAAGIGWMMGRHEMGVASVGGGDGAFHRETTLERIKRTKTFTCAYWPWPELIEKDPNTGAMSGPVVDVVEKVAENLGAKVKWQEEATIDNFVQIVVAHHVDAVCGPLFAPPWVRDQVHFVPPLFYTDFDVYVRIGDKRFNPLRDTMDQSENRLLSLDGSAAGYFALQLFPHAHHNSLPGVLGAGQILLDVADGKADTTVSEQLTAQRFLDHNPGRLAKVQWDGRPLITLGMTPLMTDGGDLQLSGAVDGILGDLRDMGVIDKILLAHHLVAGQHYRALAPRYQ